MAMIQVNDLTFSYEGSAEDVLKNVTFNIDTNWKLGLIGRNGKGKTTLLNLFMGRYDYRGSIVTNTRFDYFPYRVSEEDNKKTAAELMEKWKPQVESWQVMIQMDQLHSDPECLYRPFETLSFGERTRVMLAVLFASENEFLLVDEPLNFIDVFSRVQIEKLILQYEPTMLLVEHDVRFVEKIATKVIRIGGNQS